MPNINMQHFGELQRNQHSIDVEIDASQVASPQQDFPMMLETPNSSNSVLNIVAINEFGEQLPTEIEGVVNDKNWVHLKDLVQNVTNRKMRVFYGGIGGKPTADSTYGSEAVWGANASGIWLMGEGTGLSVNDSSENNNHGTLENGVTWVDNGLEFDGNDDYVGIPDSANWDFGGGDFTISYWINPHADSYGGGVSRWEYTTGDKRRWILVSRADTSGIEFAVSPDGTNISKAVISADNVISELDNWYHIMGVRDSLGIYLYINGVYNNFTSFTGSIPNDDIPIVFGRYQPVTSADYFNGSIRVVSIYNQAKSAGYVETYYNNSNNPTATGIGANPFYKLISKEHNFAESLQSLGRVG